MPIAALRNADRWFISYKRWITTLSLAEAAVQTAQAQLAKRREGLLERVRHGQGVSLFKTHPAFAAKNGPQGSLHSMAAQSSTHTDSQSELLELPQCRP